MNTFISHIQKYFLFIIPQNFKLYTFKDIIYTGGGGDTIQNAPLLYTRLEIKNINIFILRIITFAIIKILKFLFTLERPPPLTEKRI